MTGLGHGVTTGKSGFLGGGEQAASKSGIRLSGSSFLGERIDRFLVPSIGVVTVVYLLLQRLTGSFLGIGLPVCNHQPKPAVLVLQAVVRNRVGALLQPHASTAGDERGQ